MKLLHVRTSIEVRFHGYQQSGSTNDRPRSGRPRITNPVQDRYKHVGWGVLYDVRTFSNYFFPFLSRTFFP